MFNEILFITSFFYIGNIIYAKTVNITVTSTNFNFTTFNKTVLKMLENSICRGNYTVSIIPYNHPAPFSSPLNKNDFKDVNLVFGQRQYFSPEFFGFSEVNPVSTFPNTHINDSFMELPKRFQLMLEVANKIVENDTTKILVFVINGSLVNPQEPWKSFNPLTILSKFRGKLNIQKYNNPGDGANVCSGILLSKTVTVIMDLGRSAALDVLTNCNYQNLLNWRMRWLVFFSSMSLIDPSMFSGLPLRPNFTVYDFTKTIEADFLNTTILDEQDIIMADIAYTVVKLMDYRQCSGTLRESNLRTGRFSFVNGIVQRLNWQLDIYRANGRLERIGNIIIANGVITINQTFFPNLNLSETHLLIEMRTKPFRVAAMVDSPFVYYQSSKNQTGYCIEMIKQILSNLSVTGNITFYNLSNGLLEHNRLSGMLGLLQNGQADIVVGAITQNPQLKSLIDFTIPFEKYRISVLYKTNQTNPFMDIFDFMNAFDYKIWILIVFSCIAYAIALTLVNMISPNEAKFGFLYSFLFTVGSMVQGVTTALPDKISGRILIVFWWIFNIAVLLAYVANYGAILTNDRMQAKIQQISDLYLQEKYSYGTVKNSFVDYVLQTSLSADIQNVNQQIRSRFLHLMTETSDVAFNQVNNKSFAFIYPDILLQNYSKTACMVLTNGESQFNLTFALPANSDYTSIINKQMTILLNTSYKLDLTNKYLTTKPPEICQTTGWLEPIVDTLGTDFLGNQKQGLNINKTAGIFIIMLFGTIIALVIALIEFLIVRLCKKNGTAKIK